MSAYGFIILFPAAGVNPRRGRKVLEQVLICICRVQNSERKLCALQILYNEKEYNDESNWFPKEFLQGR